MEYKKKLVEIKEKEEKKKRERERERERTKILRRERGIVRKSNRNENWSKPS